LVKAKDKKRETMADHLLDRVKELLEEAKAFQAGSLEEVENFRIRILGKKGELNALFSEFKNVAPELRKDYGRFLNELKNKAAERVETLKGELEQSSGNSGSTEDFTRTALPFDSGSRHPISLMKNRIIEIFNRIGFTLSEGPEIEDDWHNFTALNLPEEHPARDMQDTFFVHKGPDHMLRTHTSSVQVRYMEKNQPPIRIISPGRVFRNEAVSARSHCIFHQVEGLYIDKGVSFADLRQTIMYFANEFFGEGTKIRFRPSYFPFTEPSAEVDVYWGLENEVDYRMTKGTGWLEIMGCGMVDPNVLRNCGIDPNVYSGYAFGMGIERSTMNKYQIPDIRYFFENDVRFLEQFGPAI
jgi:phenylalanyl-tRNA synthetase alpha chain